MAVRYVQEVVKARSIASSVLYDILHKHVSILPTGFVNRVLEQKDEYLSVYDIIRIRQIYLANPLIPVIFAISGKIRKIAYAFCQMHIESR